MSLYEGSFSSFRKLNQIVGFSPLLSKLATSGNIIRKLKIEAEENCKYKIHNLVNVLFTIHEGHIIPTYNYRSPIYVITSLGLLPKLLHSCIDINAITLFFVTHKNDIVDKFKELYSFKVNKECSILEKDKCMKTKKCQWVDSCTICDEPYKKSYDMKRNLTIFTNEIDVFHNILIEAFNESRILPRFGEVPFYLFGLILGCYWNSIRTFSVTFYRTEIPEDKWIKMYLDEFNLPFSDEFVDTETYILGILKEERVPQLNMIHVTKNGIMFPNCVETMLNNFFNVLLFDFETELFDLKRSFSKLHVSAKLCDFYEDLNNQLKSGKLLLSELDSYSVKLRFIDVVEGLPGIEYRNGTLNIVSSLENILKVFSILLGAPVRSLDDLKVLDNDLQHVDIQEHMFHFSDGKTNKFIELFISEGHAYSQRNLLLLNKVIGDYIVYSIVNTIFRTVEIGEETDIILTLSYFCTKYLSNIRSSEYVTVPLLYYESDFSKEFKDLIVTHGNAIYAIITEPYGIPYNLTSLRNLYVSSSSMFLISSDIGKLTSLETLGLYFNCVKNLPSEIGRLTSLKILRLAYNCIVSLPGEIGRLTSLKTLRVDNNQLKSLPREIGELTLLKMLDLFFNQLKSLPGEIERLTSLEILNLHHNYFESLPGEIGRLTSLEILNIGYNQLKSLPREIGELTSLKTLDLSHNQLKSLPEEIGRLTSLEILNVGYNQLESLPREIGELTSLKTLNLSYNQLKSLPGEIGRLTSLEILNVGYNQLESLPREIGELTSLKALDLSHNQLKSLPREIKSLLPLCTIHPDDIPIEV